MQNILKSLLILTACLFLMAGLAFGNTPIPDDPFTQEYHEPYPVGTANGINDVRAIAVDKSDCVWAGTGAGVFTLEKGSRTWRAVMSEKDAGPIYDIIVDRSGTAWIAAWNGIYRSKGDNLERVKEINEPISALCECGDNIIGLGPDGQWHLANGAWEYQIMPYSKNIRNLLPDGKNGLWLATGMGLYHRTPSGTTLYQSEEELLSADITAVDYASDGSLWIGGLGGITVYKDGKRITQYTSEHGLPSVHVRAVKHALDGRMWIGTSLGVARFDGESWSVRFSRRWLIDNDVRDIAFDSKGNAWIATGSGVSAIKQKRMNLAQKAEHYLRVCMARHVRSPYLVEKCQLTVPGDTSSWKPRDDDNDGQYTSMYLAMESFRYAATKDPQAKENADKAFQAMKFLQTVTETEGFVARTVIPSSWTQMADPNRKMNPREWAEHHVRDPRYKHVEKRWRASRDGKWLWKGDTSSDEITGHMFGYLFYYDLAAGYLEREQVREHVCRIMNYIIGNGFVLKDIDGTATRWGVWSPEKLNDDPDWATERNINSVEILSYLKLAYHLTGNEFYQNHYLKLLNEHHYAQNVRRAKTTNPSWRTHIDDELLSLAYPCLLLHEDDPELKQLYRESLDHWFSIAEVDASPFFNFIYRACTGQDPQLTTSVWALRDASLDLVRWKIDNTLREDLQVVRVPELEEIQTNRLVPPSERFMGRWDQNNWKAIQGDGGHTESDGVWWLLPYWMGRYYNFISAPK
ncbi:regulator [candidate division KSB1 bacterium]|nr:regulator [candidate division KSB1 bacterium]